MRKSTTKSIIELIFWIFALFVSSFFLGVEISRFNDSTDKLWPVLGAVVWIIFSVRCINGIATSWEKI